MHGLVALMEFQASRLRARVDAAGRAVLLHDQNRARWDHLLIRRGLTALARAEALGGSLGPYGLQAAIAACHATARTPSETPWERIAALYDALAQVAPSPVVQLNRAVALAFAFGPETGLEIVDALAAEPAIARCCPGCCAATCWSDWDGARRPRGVRTRRFTHAQRARTRPPGRARRRLRALTRSPPHRTRRRRLQVSHGGQSRSGRGSWAPEASPAGPTGLPCV